MIRLLTSGESHGESLTGILDGIPANLFIDVDFINKELKRRQGGFGRSVRMQIEKDEIELLSGVSQVKGGLGFITTGSPISISIKNKGRNIQLPEVTRPRPGHGDLVGALKFNQPGGRNILERASARETAMRVALGSICKLFLMEFDIEILSHVINIGGIDSSINYYNGLKWSNLKKIDNLRIIDEDAEKRIIKLIEKSKEEGNTLGGVIEIVARNIPPGLGSHTNWDLKLDGLLSQALFSIPGIKAVEFGQGCQVGNIQGNKFQDEIYFEDSYKRRTNNAGGIEAGISNGEDLVIRIFMKPIPTLMQPLESVDMETKESSKAQSERSDVCAVPSAGIVGESMVAFILANEFIRKFGGDFLEEIKNNHNSYIKYLKTR